jgi:hypothetical protein
VSEAGDGAGKEPGRVPTGGAEGGPGKRPAVFHRWLGRRTLRGRLIAGLLALLAMACAAIGWLPTSGCGTA